MFGDWIRRTGFWLLDFVKGSPVRKHYNDIVFGEDNRDEILSDILLYAKKHVPFYANVKGTEITDFPVMSKPIYKEQGVKCISDEFPNYLNLRKACTSGSTGTPMTVYQDPDKRNRVIADLIHAHETVGWKLGERYVFIRNWVSNYSQSKLKKIAENVIHVNIASFDDTSKFLLYKHLKKHQGYVVFGYASSICDFMQFINREKLDGKNLQLKLIVCDSDELSKANRLLLENTFNCPVVNRYDNEENGFLGITKPGSDIFNINWFAFDFALRFDQGSFDDDYYSIGYKPYLEISGEITGNLIWDLNYFKPYIGLGFGCSAGSLIKNEDFPVDVYSSLKLGFIGFDFLLNNAMTR